MAHQSHILEVSGLSKTFAVETGILQLIKNRLQKKESQVFSALNSVSFNLFAGETLGVLGESGSGKSTLARILMGIYSPDCGSARLSGKEICGASGNDRLEILRQMQMIFQDPFASLDPRMTVRQIIMEPLKIHGVRIPKDVDEFLTSALQEVGLDGAALGRYPTEFSGGQRQRIGICRALMLKPSLIIADEAVSALDVSVQAQILELLDRLKRDRGLSMIFISHDVAVVRQISDRVLLLYRGNLVEELPSEKLLDGSRHPYTRKLLSAALYLREGQKADEIIESADVEVSLEGCSYRAACPKAMDCCVKKPELIEIETGHRIACWLFDPRQNNQK